MADKKIVKAVATVTTFSVFTRALSFIFKIFLSRFVGAEIIGLYQISISVFYLFAAIGASGIPQVLSRRIAEAEAKDKGADFDGLVSSSLILGVVISATTAGLLFVLKDSLGLLFSDSRAIPLFILMCPALVSTTVYSIIRAWFWGKKAFTAFSITETLEEVLRIVFTALLVSGVVAGLNRETGIAIAFLVSDVVVAIVLIAAYFAKRGRITRPSGIKSILLPSIPVCAMRVLGGLAGTFLALVLPAKLVEYGMSPSDATAAFGRITGMANPLLFAPNALIASLAIVLIPEIAANGATGDCCALNRHVSQGIKISLLISGAFVTVYLALGENLTAFLYDDIESGLYLRWAALSMLPMAINQLMSSAMNSIGLEKQSFAGFVLSSAATMLCVIFLPRYFGIYSVALATIISLAVNIVFNYCCLKKSTGFGSEFLETLLSVLLFVLPSTYFAYSVNSVLSRFMGVWSTVISAPAGALFYFALAEITGQINVRGFITGGIKIRLTKHKKKC